MARKPKQPKTGNVGALSKRDLKELEDLRKNPQRLESMRLKLESRKKLGVAGRTELDMLAKIEALRNRKARTATSKKDLQEVFDGLARDRKPRRTGTVRATPTSGDIHFVSGGAPGLGRRR